jgi:hypothetical protein
VLLTISCGWCVHHDMRLHDNCVVPQPEGPVEKPRCLAESHTLCHREERKGRGDLRASHGIANSRDCFAPLAMTP